MSFHPQKNHDFLIEIFNEVLKERVNSKLMLIGTGELEQEIKAKVVKMGIKDKVLFLGVRENVNDFYQVLQYFYDE